MRVKSPSDCGLTKEHDYLGHFKQPKHLDRGHNRNPIDPYSEGDSTNRLLGDKPTLEMADENLAKIKSREAWEKMGDRTLKQKEVDRQIEDFAKQKRKEYKLDR